MPLRKKLTIGPLDLEWLAEALKLDELITEQPALEQLLDSFPAIHLEAWGAGLEVLQEGDRGEDIFVVRSGRLSVWRKADSGQARRIGRLETGDVFGEIGFLLKAARSATVRAETDCKLFRLPAGEFARLLRKHKMLSRWIKSVACSRLLHLFQDE